MGETAIVHDYLTQRGGAERVVLSLHRVFPGAPIHTSLFDPSGTYAEFGDCDVRVSGLDRLHVLRRDHRRALPLLAPTFSAMRIDADVTICSSSGWAHGVRAEGAKVVYCHAPARWLHQGAAYSAALPWPRRLALSALGRPLIRWDRRAAHSADVYVVNSNRTREFVRSAYGIDARVVHPPFGDHLDGPDEPVPGLEEGYFLCVSRLLPYKNLESLLAAFADLGSERLVIVGSGPDEQRLRAMAPSNVHFLSGITDGQLRWVYRHAEALFAVGVEDFGLTPVEAARAGTPTIAWSFGGYLDTVTEGVNGVFVAGTGISDIVGGVRRLRADRPDRRSIVESTARFAPEHFAAELLGIVDSVR